jgi:hypothetical protein
MATEMELTQLELQGVLEPGLANKSDASNASHRILRHSFTVQALLANEANASTTASDAPLWRAPARSRLVSARLIPATALNTDGTDLAHVMLTQNADNGGSQANLARMITGSGGVGNLAAGISGAFTVITASGADVINAGQMVHFTTVKLGAGVVVPICKVELEVEKI